MSAARTDLAAFCDAVPHLIITLALGDDEPFANQRWFDYTGSTGISGGGRHWIERLHPDDRQHVEDLAHRAITYDEPLRAECRLRDRENGFRWFLAQSGAVRGSQGHAARWLITFTEIESLKRSEQVYMVLAHELGHRVRNIFSIFSGLVRLSSPKHPAAADFAAELQARVAALAVANELAVPTADAGPGASTTLPALIDKLLTPYRTTGGARISLDLEDLPVGLTGANALALIIHEQATNAVKYGSLSASSGRLVVEGRRCENHYVVTWAESGGPRLGDAPQHRGFGSRLTDQTVSRQLGGQVVRRWIPEGLSMELHLPIERLTS